jgi:erythromycin esterase
MTQYHRLLDWARSAWRPADRASLDGLIGEARIVSLGEGLHGAHEPLLFRNAWFAQLAELQGFNAIGLESGLAEGLMIDSFVQGAAGDASSAVSAGITSGLHAFPEQVVLVEWMRAFNSRSPNRRLAFFGFDISNAHAALERALSFLDEPAAATLRKRLEPAWSQLVVDRRASVPTGYATLDAAVRDAVTAAVVAIGVQIERSVPSDAALDAALAARQADLYLRQIPIGWCAAQGLTGLWASVALSDRVKAENVERMLHRCDPDGRLLLFSHLGHASTLPVSIEMAGQRIGLPLMMGQHLHRRFGTAMLTIGHLIGDNQCQPEIGAASPDSLESGLATLGQDALLLDLREAPHDVRTELLAAPHPLHGQQPIHLLSPGLGVDILFFTARATPAR